jgi:hypothetical protein
MNAMKCIKPGICDPLVSLKGLLWVEKRRDSFGTPYVQL